MTLNKYIKISFGREAYILKDSRAILKDIDSVLFDCDGVLIDTRESYDNAIVESVSILFKKILNIELIGSYITPSHIYVLRATGGFNNDTDTVYILSLWLFTGLQKSRAEVLTSLDSIVNDVRNPRDLLSKVSQIVASETGYLPHEVAPTPQPLEKAISESMRRVGSQVLSINDLEETLREVARQNGFVELFDIFSSILGKPGKYGQSLVETLFCDLYYGPENVRRIFEDGPFFDLGPGMYLKERVNIDESTLRWLSEKVGTKRVGIVSGRDRISTELVLGGLMRYFNRDACVFLADEYRVLGEIVKKPSPYGVLKAVSRMEGASSPLYVGNSAEDYFMTKSSEKYGMKASFASIIGLAPNPSDTIEFFASLGADTILWSPDDIVKILGMF
ncbi:MAG: HAD family hydrolase [Nitrososphaerota archaeon]